MSRLVVHWRGKARWEGGELYECIDETLDWQDDLQVCTLDSSNLSRLGLYPDPVIKCHPIVSQAG